MKKKIIANFPPNTEFPVYCIHCWWSDDWDPMDYGMDYDPNRSFFDQLAELRKRVPRIALLQHKNENSEYTNCVTNLKDCYLLFSSDFNQNCMYGVWTMHSKDSLDNLLLISGQLTYETVFCEQMHNTSFAYFSKQCSDSAFLMDCRNLTNCFRCFGLRNKEYCIANKQYSKEEYFEKLKEFPMSSYSNLEKAKAHFFQMIEKATYPDMRKRGTVIDSTGNFLTDCVNCVDSYEVTDARDCKYVMGGYQIKDAMDCNYVNQEKGYENCECFPMPIHSIGCVNSYEGADQFYTDNCMNNCTDIFGGISLKPTILAKCKTTLLGKCWPVPNADGITKSFSKNSHFIANKIYRFLANAMNVEFWRATNGASIARCLSENAWNVKKRSKRLLPPTDPKK
ncbi:hypothetical protein IPJ72_05785 [Candidatus Peregrinibacteria bacterium]|nr:MAG: hypothetical protein IPJ72_05785 [Candidatus Peregrinibacteria bacterium]